MRVRRFVLISLLSVFVSGTAPAWAQDTAPGSVPAAAKPEEAAPTTAGGSGDSVDDSNYAVRLRGLEEKVNDLKERIFRSKARLILLKETVLNGVISGAKAVIIHRN